MSNYPDWVLKHKKKGMYINCVKGKYYLYAAHSERIPGTNKVRRVSDGYIGHITEKDGLILSRNKVKNDIQVYEYGISDLILRTCKYIYQGFKRSYKYAADNIMCSSILLFIYGRYDQVVFKFSYLSVLYPNVSFDKELTDDQKLAIQRGVMMFKDVLTKTFGDDTNDVLLHFSNSFMMNVDGKFYPSKESNEFIAIKNKYNL